MQDSYPRPPRIDGKPAWTGPRDLDDPLAPVRYPSGSVNWLEVGRIEQMYVHDRVAYDELPADERSAHQWLLQQPGGPLYVMRARDKYGQWFDQRAADFGFTHVERVQYRHGKVTRTVHRLRPSHRAARGVRNRARAREHRPAATRRASSSSSTSSADPGDAGSDSDGSTDPLLHRHPRWGACSRDLIAFLEAEALR